MLDKKNKLQKGSKHFPSSVREWNNSIYVYNKNTLSLIPTATVSVMKIIKSYFDLFNKKLERKVRSKGLLRRYRRISSNRIYLSKGEFKHTNSKVLINIYLYNRQKYNYLNKLKRYYLGRFLGNRVTKKERNYISSYNTSSKVQQDRVKKKLNRIISKRKNSINRKIISNLKSIYTKGLNLLKTSNNKKYVLIKFLKNNPKYKISCFKDISKSTVNFYKKVLKRSMRKLFVYLFYKQLLFINKSKLNYNYLQKLKIYLEMLYNKNVEFNFINLKNLFLNSDIMSEVAKLKLTRNRRRLGKLMKNFKDKIKIQDDLIFLKQLEYIKSQAGYKTKVNYKLNDLRSNKIDLKEHVIDNLKYKDITGYRLEARGRLTRRHKAARAISKVKYKGNLSNIDSSINGISSVILKGNLRANLQYSKCYSKTRIGAFGLKGWVSGY